jgi:hypothetical protein
MAKKLVYNYTFNPGGPNSGNVVVAGKIPLRRMLLITNNSTGDIIFNFADPAKGATVTYNTATNQTTLTLENNTSAMSSADELQIFYDDDEIEIKPNQTYQDPVEKMRVSTPQSMMDTDFEYSLQATKWESVQLQNNISSIFQRANEPAFTASDIVSIVQPAATPGFVGQAISTTFVENGRTGMTTRFNSTVDDTNIALNSPFTINFLGINYSTVFFGSNGYLTFGAGSSQYSGLSPEDQPGGLPGLKWNAADQQIAFLSDITIGSAPNRTWVVRWEGSQLGGPTGAIIVELRFNEGQNNIEVHYVNNNSNGFIGLQDGSGPSTTYLATWTPSTNSNFPYNTGQGFRVSWGTTNASNTLEVTVAVAPALPFTVGSPIVLKETKDTLYLDGAFLITTVVSTTKFRFVHRSPTAYVGDQKTDYTALYTGGFFSNSSLPLASIQSISGTTRARITFSSNHALYVGSKLYVIDTAAATDANWVGARDVARVVSDTQVEYQTGALSNFGSTTTLSGGTTAVYVRNEGIASHRYLDGGVQINPSSNSPNCQIIRQTRKYFRYQSGKGVMFSTGVLFKPVYDAAIWNVLTNVYRAGTNEVYSLTITTDQEHGFAAASTYLEGTKIRLSGFTVTGGNNPYNGEYRIVSIVNRNTFTVNINVSAANGGLPSDTNPGGIPKLEVIEWNDATVRSGLFDDQNGLFFEHDGKYLYAVKRSSTNQLAGRIEISQNSSTVTGTNTKFLTQLKEEDNIVIKGGNYIVTKITSDTSLTVSPDYRATTVSDVKFVKTIDDRYRQDQFNMDKLDGTGPSGYVLDPNKMQMVFIDYSWYGAGKVRWGIRTTDGNIQYIHEAKQNNVNTEAYMRTGNLPGRFEISSKSKTGRLLTAMTAVSTTININESEASFIPSAGTIIVNNEYINYTKGSLNGSVRTLNLITRNIGGLLSGATTATIGDTWVSFNQNCSPSLSHWGVSVVMDGRFDTDKSYLFTASTAGGSSGYQTVTNGSRVPLLTLRLAPSVDFGIPGFYGVRNLINRSALTLESIGLSTDGNFSIDVRINAESPALSNIANWRRSPNGSISQYIDHSITAATFTGGDVVTAFFAEDGAGRFVNTRFEIATIRELGKSILGGPGVYPDGPDTLTIFATNISGQNRRIAARLTWTESQG